MLSRTDTLSGVRGAVYVPARATNASQTWRGYDPATVERDLGYAVRLNLDTLRLFLSYEHWLEAPTAHQQAVDHLFEAAATRGLRVVPVLFESAGEEPTPGNLVDDDPVTGCAVQSPASAVVRNRWYPRALRGPYGVSRTLRGLLRREHRWDEPAAYVEWVLERYGDAESLLAVEVMNEPGGWDAREAFARAMLRTAADHPVEVPLTMGCKSLPNCRAYDDPTLDVLQFHYNLPPTAVDVAEALETAREVAAESDAPVWLTEWQRTREEPPDVMLPNYASLAETVRAGGIDGDFLWSLMLKPAYLPTPRRWGRLNGIFHEDGAVWSRTDARAVAADPTLAIEERRAWPEWGEPTAEAVGAPRPKRPPRD